MLYAVKEPKNKKAKRALMAREPKMVENEKKAMMLHGHSCSQLIKQFLDEMAALKQPNVIKLSRKNKILPFEDEHPLEFLAHKNDASLFMLGTSNKKRPNNVVMGRMFDFGVEAFRPASQFAAPAPGVGMRPCFVFCGDEFEQNEEMKRFGNLMLDFFGGRHTTMVNLRGLESVMVLTAVQGVVHFHHYSVTLQKSSDRVPRVELEEVGPSFQARLGTVHVGKQDLSSLVLKKNRALRKSNKAFRDGEEDVNDDASLKKPKKAKMAEADPTDV